MSYENTPSPLDVKAAVDELHGAFEAFKVENNAGGTDPLAQEKLDRLNEHVGALQSRVDQLSAKSQRPGLSNAASAAAPNKRDDFVDGFMRKGIEAKSLNITADAEGGSAVPDEVDTAVDTVLADLSPVRSVANVVRVGSANYKKLITLGQPASGWVGETATRAETDTPTFQEITPPYGEIYANPAASQAMLDDARFDVESWLAQELAQEFAVQEGAAFVSGNGTAKPKGFLDYPTSNAGDDTRPFGTLQTVVTGSAGAFPSSDPADILVDLIHALRPAYRQNAVFMMNTQTLSEIRKFKDADGAYLWRPGMADQMPSTLLGYPVIEAEDMDPIAGGNSAVVFGNFKRGYLIADRHATRILRDPYSNKPFVHFYATRRVSGAVVDSNALKLLKFSAS
ncbi:MAG: phage major capsid protein [Pseudomonadota bacterium]